MAEIAWTVDALPEGKQLPTGVKVVKWVLAAGDTGAPYYAPQFAGKAVQRTAATATAVATMEGTLIPEGVTPVWGTLHTPQGVDLVLNDANGTELLQVLEDCYAIRPNVTVAGCTVYLFVSTVARR